MLTNSMHTYNTPPRRRGVTLLVVLALMVMFAMLVTAFMVIVTQMRRTVESTANVRLTPPESISASANWGSHNDPDAALQTLLTGGLQNVIGPHSILENLYGHTPTALELENSDLDGVSIQHGLLRLQLKTNQLSNKLLGHVVTVQRPDTFLHNKSTLVVDSGSEMVNSVTVDFIDLAPFSVPETVGQQSEALQDCTLIFNAPAHSGTGAGYDSNKTDKAWNSLVDNLVNGKPFALRPNALAPNSNGAQAYKTFLTNNDVRMNPDYTAPDYMTMFLAWNDIRHNQLERVIPSFHRPQLVKYWRNVTPVTDPEADRITELRKYVLRPLPMDHPNFTGSNPAADRRSVNGLQALEQFLTEGPWDVDNDNDGFYDGIWLDVGLPVRYDVQTRTSYKPLVSYYVIDMDGKINVNTLDSVLSKQAGAEPGPKGTGMGPAELSSTLILENVLAERYGQDGSPSGTGSNTSVYGTWGGLPADWFGFSPIDFDALGNRLVTLPTDEPTNPYLFNPYSGTNGDNPFTPDQLAALLRSVIDFDYTTLPQRLRTALGDLFDPTKPAMTQPQFRYNITTQSSDIPVSSSAFAQDSKPLWSSLWTLLPEEIRRGGKVNLNRLTQQPNWNSTTPLTEVQHIELLKAKVRFAQEIFYLLRILVPMDKQTDVGLERLAQWSVNLVDFIDPDDVMTPFIYKKTEIDPNTITAFDNAEPINELLTNTDNFVLGADEALIWGFEKPEVALTETLAFHDRKVADTSLNNYTNSSGDDPNDPAVPPAQLVPDPTFDQVVRPQGSLFVELYRQGNPQRTYPANCVVEPGGTLDLAKRTVAANANEIGDYVWRLAIGEPAKTSATANRFDWQSDPSLKAKNALEQMMIPDASGTAVYPQFRQWRDETMPDYHPDLGMPERFIWFGNELPTEYQPITPTNFDHGIQYRSFYNKANVSVELAPDSTLLIVPRAVTTLTKPEQTLDFSDPVKLPTNTKTMMAVNPDVFSSAGQFSLGVNVSEPLPTPLPLPTPQFGDGYLSKGPLPNDTPFDDGILKSRGTIPCYKTIALQRLTDPNRPHHPICNPYITVDWNMIDLHVFTTEARPADSDGVAIDEETADFQKDDDMTFVSREWNNKTDKFLNIWDRARERNVVDTTGNAIPGKADLPESPPTQFFQENGAITTVAQHTLGTPPSALQEMAGPGNPIPSPPQLHFPWHDAPFMNSGEVMLVPLTAPGRFGMEFHDNRFNYRPFADRISFFGLHEPLRNEGDTDDQNTPRFGYLYQNYAYAPYLNWGDFAETATDEPYMQKLFDFVHIPSKFASTVQGLTTGENPKPIYSMREPGKINLNTLTEEGWKTLQDGRTDFPTYELYRQYRQWSTLANDPHYPSEFMPFRSPSGTHFVPPLEGGDPQRMYDTATSATLLALEESGEPALVDEDAANPYTALEGVMRLSDVTTTRSNVFAVWITVGYFEVKQFNDSAELKYAYPSIPASASQISAIYPDLCVLGEEKGHANGTVKRHRAFYLIDRSKPVGFRRGQEMNSQDVIIQKNILD